jgi:hypothetical protein
VCGVRGVLCGARASFQHRMLGGDLVTSNQ